MRLGLSLRLGRNRKTSKTKLPADFGSGAAAAYSLRYVSNSYSGSVIRVREDGSNNEQDFTPTQITDGTLATFCGANNGFVTTWYDQSGNSNDATQETAASQPKVYDSSTGVVMENGKAALDFDGSSHQLIFNNATSLTDLSTFTVFAADSNAQDATIFHYSIDFTNIVAVGLGDLGTNARIGHRYIFDGTFYTSGEDFNTTDLSLVSTISTGGNSTQLYLNSEAGTKAYASRSGGDISTIGSRGNVIYFNGKVSEVIFYESDQSANRTAIESNINAHYSIYSLP